MNEPEQAVIVALIFNVFHAITPQKMEAPRYKIHPDGRTVWTQVNGRTLSGIELPTLTYRHVPRN